MDQLNPNLKKHLLTFSYGLGWRRANTVTQSISSQRGYALVGALLSLVIAAFLTNSQIQAQQLKTHIDAGTTEAQVINLIADAVNSYTMENYPALQSGLVVEKNGITLADGSNVGESLSPSVSNLVAMGYLQIGTTDTSLHTGGTYQIRLRREPAGCSDRDCDLPGFVYIDQPATLYGSVDMNGPLVGAFANKIGGSVLYSTNASPGTLTGPSGVTLPNPLGDTPGVLGVAAGFGAAGFGRFLTLNDPRDPNFQGDLTVRGTIESRTEISLTNPTDTCDIARIWTNATGVSEFLAQSAACVQRAWVRGDGTIGVADAAATRRAEMDGTSGTITAFDTDGVTPRAGFSYNPLGQSEVYADNIRNSAPPGSTNEAGIAIDGRVYGRMGQFDSVVLNTTAVLYASCTQSGEMVWGTFNGNPILMKCEGGVYVPLDGVSIALEGGICSPDGATAKTSNGVHLICEGAIWKTTLQRIGRVQMDDAFLVTTGISVPKPNCAPGGTATVMLLPAVLSAETSILNYTASDQGSSWLITILDNNGDPSINSRALANTYCSY